MPVTRRSRQVAATPEAVWALVEDPHHMPRWWPELKRMEDVQEDRWTQVFISKRGRAVRADFHLLASDPPGPGGYPAGRRAWEQDVVGTPFERVLAESVTELIVEPSGDGTMITLAQRQKLRGYSRTGGFLLRRATREKLDEALEGIEQAIG
jgi:carbon monoxide dehydrogenase subunit G